MDVKATSDLRVPFRRDRKIPVWMKLGYAAAVPAIGVVYWYAYGPQNYLWLSDIALVLTALAVILGNRLLASMPAVGVLPLEIAWAVDFLAGGNTTGMAAYMFDGELPLYLRALSGFHLALPPTLIYLLWKLGYDRRAFALQTLVTWAALAAAYAWSDREENINWVFGPANEPQQIVPPLVYLGLEMVVIPLVIMLPTHFVLMRLFGRQSGQSDH